MLIHPFDGLFVIGHDSSLAGDIVTSLAAHQFNVKTFHLSEFCDQRLTSYVKNVERLFDPNCFQGDAFPNGWKEIPGFDRLQAKGQALLHETFKNDGPWAIVEPRLGSFYPFFRSLVEDIEANVPNVVVVQRGVTEGWGEYAHRLISAIYYCKPADTKFVRPRMPLSVQLKAWCPDFEWCDSDIATEMREDEERPPQVLASIFDQIDCILEEGRDWQSPGHREEIRSVWEEWISGGEIANASFGPGNLIVAGLGATDQVIRTFADRSWHCLTLNLGPTADGQISLHFFPQARTLFVRNFLLLNSDGKTTKPDLKSEPGVTMESRQDGILRICGFALPIGIGFKVPDRGSSYELRLEYQIHDDDLAVRSMVGELSNQVTSLRTGPGR